MHNGEFNIDALFVFILICAGNYLGEIFPCKFQRMLKHNMFMRHTVGLLTLLFFVIIQSPIKVHNLLKNVTTTGLLYGGFLILTKTTHKVFLFSISIMAMMYIMNLKISELHNDCAAGCTEDVVRSNAVLAGQLIDILYWTRITLLGVCTGGFIVSIGRRKHEYGDKFKYGSYIFGTQECKNDGKGYVGKYLSILDSFVRAFT